MTGNQQLRTLLSFITLAPPPLPLSFITITFPPSCGIMISLIFPGYSTKHRLNPELSTQTPASYRLRQSRMVGLYRREVGRPVGQSGWVHCRHGEVGARERPSALPWSFPDRWTIENWNCCRAWSHRDSIPSISLKRCSHTNDL